MAPDSPQWPAVGYEELRWRPRLDVAPGVASRRALAEHTGPYPAAMVPRIAQSQLSLPPQALVEIEAAADAIARLDNEGGATLAPFAGVLLRTESASSSQIEQLTASARAIAEAEIGVRRTGNGLAIVANTAAMKVAIGAQHLGEAEILQMHAALLGEHDPRIAGRWREEQVWIGGSDLGPRGATFVPPAAPRVPSAMADLVAFMGRDDLPVLAQAALAHAQFETIHPFADGNGRTGRALLHALLRNKGMTSRVIVPVSAGLLTNVADYFDALTAYREGDVAPIVISVCRAAVHACDNGRQLVADLMAIRSQWSTLITARSDSATWLIADLLMRQPVIDSAVLAREIGAPAANNASRYLKPLVDAGLVLESSGPGRRRVWRAPAPLEALDDFARRAGRRAPRRAQSR